MKIWRVSMNNGQWGGIEREMVVAETREEAIEIIKKEYPYRIKSYDFWAVEFAVEGYDIVLIPKEEK